MSVSLLDPRNGEAFDLSPAQVPGRTYVVASTPRTGSTLLCRLLWDLGCAGAPKEYLNPMQMRDWEVRLGESRLWSLCCGWLRGPAVGLLGQRRWTREELGRYIDRVRQRRTSAAGPADGARPDGSIGPCNSCGHECFRKAPTRPRVKGRWCASTEAEGFWG